MLASKAKESAAVSLAKLDAVKGRLLVSSDKKSDKLQKMQDWAKKQAEALRQIEVIEKAERETAVVKIVEENKRVMKRIESTTGRWWIV